MLRVTFELLPGGSEAGKRTIGMMEVARISLDAKGYAEYAVALKKTPPFDGALRLAWRKGKVGYNDLQLNSVMSGEDEELITALVNGHHRTRRGVYDLLYKALLACGLDKRNWSRDA